MQTIDIGDVVRFQLPPEWQEWIPEEEEDEGEERSFYDPSEETSLLHVVLEQGSSAEALTVAALRAVLEETAEPYDPDILDLGDGRLLNRFAGEESGKNEPLMIYYWQVGYLHSAHELSIVIFTYGVGFDAVEDETVVANRTMLDREIRACRFSAQESD